MHVARLPVTTLIDIHQYYKHKEKPCRSGSAGTAGLFILKLNCCITNIKMPDRLVYWGCYFAPGLDKANNYAYVR